MVFPRSPWTVEAYHEALTPLPVHDEVREAPREGAPAEGISGHWVIELHRARVPPWISLVG